MIRLALLLSATAALAVELPPPAGRPVDFVKDIQPLLEAACVKCHAKGKEKGGFSLETREHLLKGGDSGAGAVVGDSAKSKVVELVATDDKDDAMPKKGKRWTAEQVGLLRAWIDQGAAWPAGVTFAKPLPQNLARHAVELPRGEGNPVDRLLSPYLAQHGIALPPVAGDAVYARRAYLDVIGLLPTTAQLTAFEKDAGADKRERLVRALLADRRGYADHWLTFWNDLLRNDYKGTGYIDGGREQVTGWLYEALYTNKPYNRFVAELVDPVPASEGFTKGIVWRGNVNASMTPPMQAAQNISQVFLGVNLKCASCHDSFINDWALADCYGLAAVFADGPLELTQCDKPTGKKAAVRFLYPEIGEIDAKLDKPGRIARVAELLTSEKNGRLSRTIVNRLWARLMGRGLVEPLDDMEQSAWSRELLDWLAEDLVAHQWNVKRTLEVILTSRAYALPSVESPADAKAEFVFRGPLARRMGAEQFADAISTLAGDWPKLPVSMDFQFGPAAGAKFTPPRWIWTGEPLELGARRLAEQAAQGQLDRALQKLQAAQKAEAEAKKETPVTPVKPEAPKTAMLEKAAAPEKKGDAKKPDPKKVEPPKFDPVAARKAVDDANAAVTAARTKLADAAKTKAVGQPGVVLARPDGDRHPVVFRRHFTLKEAPGEAPAALAASQNFVLMVNGKEAKATMTNEYAKSRARLYDVRSLLVKGDNVIAINVSSHTERSLDGGQRKQHPESINHLNKTPGFAFYLRATQAGGAPVEVVTDASWRSTRAPFGDWASAKVADDKWPAAQVLEGGAWPIDEGAALPPVERKPVARVDVAVAFGPALELAAEPPRIRASLLAADTLQVALERPNREVVVPARAVVATTLQALELTNGATLDARLKAASAKLAAQAAKDPAQWLEDLYRQALSRSPQAAERTAALELLGPKPTPEAVADVVWAVVNLPEFQLIQ